MASDLHAAHFDAQALQQFRGLGLSQQTRFLQVEAVEDLPQAVHLAVSKKTGWGDGEGDFLREKCGKCGKLMENI